MEHKTDILQRAHPVVVEGDLLDQDVEAIVNPWNRNIIPWWLLLPQGVSGAIKRRGGTGAFRELARAGSIPLGGAVITSAGQLPFKHIIHVAGINMLWRSSRESIQDSVRSAMTIVHQHGFGSVAFPIIGAGSGSHDEQAALQLMLEAFEEIGSAAEVLVVRFRPAKRR
ncbi:macro domain-containing protein [Lysobacter enzymogenes]|uniref:Appr-1-p processing protein n=1 Tax=Lysobacter enzymogenes TaxID=69 RepID=A0A3N2RDG3_LYSEN|nr:macro domain-containing protein [Lysobacter enzymogenes]ROU05483.1 Appr-1-p processing protein [Lysobacter enzymogenes]